MKVAVIGGTGTLGRLVVEEVRRAGQEARVLSRHSRDYPVDLATGAGLEAALEGCEAVVDASNAVRKVEEVLVNGSRRLLAAEKAAGVGHHVCVSIVGCDLVPVGYYRAKTEQERVVKEGTVPWTIVRSTQFHEFIAGLFAQAGRWRVLPMLRTPLQTIAAAEAAAATVEIALGEPRMRRLNVAGPEIADARELARLWQRSAVRRAALRLPVPLPGKMGQALRAGAATAEHPDFKGKMTFADWLRMGGE